MHPAILEIGSVAISSLWFFITIGFLVSGIILIKLALKNSLKIAFLTQHFFQIIFSGLIFSRLVYIIFNSYEYFYDDAFSTILQIISLWDKGLSFWGAVLGMVIAFYYYTKKEEESFLKWMDMFTIALLGGMIFGNIGAFLEGVNYGQETMLPWGVTFQNFNIPYTIAIHPSQLYALLYTGGIFATLLTLFLKEKSQREGDITLYGILTYSFFRFLEEFTRGEETSFIFLSLRMEQWVALLGIIFATFFLVQKSRKL